MPGALTPQQVLDLIPKDIVVANWFWHDARAAEGRGEPNDVKLSDWGFQQVHANFMYNIQNYARRTARPGVIGGAPSAWAATNQYTFGKDLMMDFLGTANLMWSTHWPDEESLSKTVQSLMPRSAAIFKADRAQRGGRSGATGRHRQAANTAASGLDLPVIKQGRLDDGNQHFDVQSPVIVGVQGAAKATLPLQSAPIPIGADVSSIVFLHASARPSANDMSYRYIHNFPIPPTCWAGMKWSMTMGSPKAFPYALAGTFCRSPGGSNRTWFRRATRKSWIMPMLRIGSLGGLNAVRF